METIDETESRYEKESISSRTGRELVQPTTTTTAPSLTTEPATNVIFFLFNFIINYTRI